MAIRHTALQRGVNLECNPRRWLLDWVFWHQNVVIVSIVNSYTERHLFLVRLVTSHWSSTYPENFQFVNKLITNVYKNVQVSTKAQLLYHLCLKYSEVQKLSAIKLSEFCKNFRNLAKTFGVFWKSIFELCSKTFGVFFSWVIKLKTFEVFFIWHLKLGQNQPIFSEIGSKWTGSRRKRLDS